MTEAKLYDREASIVWALAPPGNEVASCSNGTLWIENVIKHIRDYYKHRNQPIYESSGSRGWQNGTGISLSFKQLVFLRARCPRKCLLSCHRTSLSVETAEHARYLLVFQPHLGWSTVPLHWLWVTSCIRSIIILPRQLLSIPLSPPYLELHFLFPGLYYSNSLLIT